jgi:hypothetical protein
MLLPARRVVEIAAVYSAAGSVTWPAFAA